MQILTRSILVEDNGQSYSGFIAEAMPALLNWAYENKCPEPKFYVMEEKQFEKYRAVVCEITVP